jgi:hypothetical protein
VGDMPSVAKCNDLGNVINNVLTYRALQATAHHSLFEMYLHVILITNNIVIQSIDLKQFCHKKTLEICAVKLHLKTTKLIVLCIYRAPAGNLNQFYDTLENILNHFLQTHVTFLICGDLNINLFSKHNDALKLLTLMNTFNLTQVVDFPTRINNNNGKLIDIIFVDTLLYDKIQVNPFINGLSDHDAQIIYLQNSNTGLQQRVSKIKCRLINEQTIKHFQALLEDETWDTVYKSTCTNVQQISRYFLRYYEASFPTFYTNHRSNHNNWVTKGIKISCAKKMFYSLYTRGI